MVQGGSLYHFYDDLWYDPIERRTRDLPCERRTLPTEPIRHSNTEFGRKTKRSYLRIKKGNCSLSIGMFLLTPSYFCSFNYAKCATTT